MQTNPRLDRGGVQTAEASSASLGLIEKRWLHVDIHTAEVTVDWVVGSSRTSGFVSFGGRLAVVGRGELPREVVLQREEQPFDQLWRHGVLVQVVEEDQDRGDKAEKQGDQTNVHAGAVTRITLLATATGAALFPTTRIAFSLIATFGLRLHQSIAKVHGIENSNDKKEFALPCDGLNPRHVTGGHFLLLRLLISAPLSNMNYFYSFSLVNGIASEPVIAFFF